MTTNLILGYPQLFYNASSVEYSHAYSSSFPAGNLFHAGRGRWAELAAATQFTNYIDVDMGSAESLSKYLAICRASLLRGSGVESVVARSCSVSWNYPSSISDLQFWFDSGRNVVRVATSGSKAIDTITERSSNAISGTATTNVYHSEMSSNANWLKYSEQFNTAPWAGSQLTVTPNTVANPINFTDITADTLTEAASNAQHYVQQTGIPIALNGVTYRLSIYAKKANRDHLWIQMGGAFASGPYRFFNLNTGALGSSGGTLAGSTIEDVGNGWYRCTITAVATSTANINVYIGVSPTDGVITYLGTGTNGVYVFGAQLNENANSTTYLPTTLMRRPAGVNSNRSAIFIEDARIDFGNPGALSITGDMSVFAAVYPKFTDTNARYLIDHEAINSNGWGWYKNSANRMVYSNNRLGDRDQVTATTALTNNAFNSIGVVFESAVATHYLNGSTNGSGAALAPTAPSTNFYMADSTALQGFQGYVCEVLIYDRALSAKEIADIETYFQTRWNDSSANAVTSIHDIQTRTLQGPKLDDIYVSSSLTGNQYYRLEFDTENSSVRRSGHILTGSGVDISRDPLYGREIVQKWVPFNKGLKYAFELDWEGITNANRVALQNALGNFKDAHTVVLYPVTDTGVLGGLDGIECYIMKCDFTPEVLGLNSLRMEFMEVF